jgi:hypothetical protein
VLRSHDGISPVGSPWPDDPWGDGHPAEKHASKPLTYRDEGGRKVWDPQWAEKGPRKRSKPRWGVLGGILLGAPILVAALLLAPTTDTVTPVLQRGAEAVANMQDNGTLTPEAATDRQASARQESGCGWVQLFVVPAPAPSTQEQGPTMGGGSQPSDPLKQVVDYIVKTYRPDSLAALLSPDKTKVVIMAGWAC